MARHRTPVVLTELGRYTCRHCGVRFAWQSTRPNGGGKPPAFCSTKCQHDSRKTLRGTCLYCGGEVWSHKPASYCSPACHQPNPLRSELPADHWARWYGATSVLPVRRPRFTGAWCQRCGTGFVVDRGRGSPPRYCSRRCRRADNRARRRARKSGAYVTRVWRRRVFERDGWTCHLCRRKVRRSAVVPHPLAPVIDHVVPLSAGGAHEPANCRCAHFICNSIKRDAGGGEQLLLIG